MIKKVRYRRKNYSAEPSGLTASYFTIRKLVLGMAALGILGTLGKRIATIGIAAAILVWPGLVQAQDSRGTILGRVTDNTAGVTPGVEIQLSNAATGVTLRTTSNEVGGFRFPYLVSGSYTIVADKPGFKQFIREGIQVQVADSVEVNVILSIGDITEKIEVTGEAPPLATADASLGTVINRESITELPIRDGSPAELALLSSGVVNTQSLRQRKAYTTLAISEISSNGNGSLGNQFTLDGIPNYASDRIAFSPPTTAVQEFKVQTATYDAGTGFTMGATINMVTLGGSNALHGEAHEWFRNKSLDANSFFNNMAGRKKDNYKDNRFGASLGGPIVIPKLYNGKNKSFFFFAYEGNPNSVPSEGTVTTVPTAKERTGDLSDLLQFGSAYQIYNPHTISFDGTRYLRQPYAGNIIPASSLDPVSKNIIAKYYPLPNQDPQNPVGFRRNFRSPRPLNANEYNTYTSRLDHNFSDRDRMFGRFSMDRWHSDGGDQYGNIATGSVTERMNRVAAIDNVFVISSNKVLDVRYGYTRVLFPITQRSTGKVDLASLGFSPEFTGLMVKDRAAFPTMAIDGGKYGGFGNGTDRRIYNDTHSFSGTFSWTRSSHNMRFGADYRVERLNGGVQTRDNSPRVNFNNMWTKGPNDTSVGQPIGGGLASFMLGLPDTTGFMLVSANFALQSIRNGFFFQDDWKINRKLSVNLGLRYELDNPMTERYNRFINGFDPSAQLSITSAVEANYANNPLAGLPSKLNIRGGDLYAGGVNSRGAWSRDMSNIMPRLGLAYQLNDKTVLRAGFGMYYDTIGVNLVTPSWNNNQLRFSQNGFTGTTYVIPSIDNGQHFIASLGNPFPNGLRQPVGSSLGVNADLGNSLPLVWENAQNPFARRFSLGIQRQLPGKLVLDVSYVGSRGGRLYSNGEVNTIGDASHFSTTGRRDNAAIDFMDGQVTSPFIVNGTSLLAGKSLGGNTLSRSQLLMTYPAYAGGGGDTFKGKSWYDSLQVSMDRRFSNGLILDGTLTWQKSQAQQWQKQGFRSEYERVIDGSDPGKRFTLNGVYELPFGRGRHWGSQSNRLMNAALGGWQVGSILRMQGGMPAYVANMLLLPGKTMRDAVLPKSQRTWQQWFNYAPFDMNPDNQLAWNVQTLSSYYGFLRGPGYVLVDANLSKNFAIRERMKLQFRAEAFNAFNHMNFGGDTAPTIDTWGTDAGSVASQNGYPRNVQLALRLTF